MKGYKTIPAGRAKNLTGMVSCRLTILDRVDIGKKDTAYWLAECSCGNHHVVRSSDFISGKIKSCGCLSREQSSINGKLNLKDLTGMKFNKLTVSKRVKDNRKKATMWLCECDCGNTNVVSSENLKVGNVKSCGCIVDNKYKDMAYSHVGERYNKLIIIRPTKKIKQGKRQFLLKCNCGKYCYGDLSNMRNNNKQSCGCYHREKVIEANKSKNMKLENHPRWNPNLTDEERTLNRNRISKDGSINEWRKQVYQRDYWTCQVCKTKAKEIHAHHLDGWNWAKDKRYDVSNGVTLCAGCHVLFHQSYGYGNNTKEQFNKFALTKTLAK